MDPSDESGAAAAEQMTPGGMLRAAREAQGISPREMADRLNWMPSHVLAIEENRFEVMRGAAFVRGYLRAYARLMQVPESDLLRAYEALELPADAEAANRESGSRAGGQTQALAIGAGIVIALLLAAGLWWAQQDENGDVPARTASSDALPAATQPAGSRLASAQAEQAPVAAVPTPAAPVADDSPAPAAQLPVRKPEPAPVEPLQPVSAPESQVPTAVSAETGTDAAEPLPETPAVSDAADLLEFAFSGDCWVEVRDAAGELIYADLRAQDDVLRLQGEPPFDILLGDAHSVQLQFRGAAVDVPTRPGRTVARFTVAGQ